MNKLLSTARDYLNSALLRVSLGVASIIPGPEGGIKQTQPCVDNANADLINCTINGIGNKFLNVFFTIITGLALILLIGAGIQYIQSLGNQEELKRARLRIVHIVVGIIILVAAYAVLNLIVNLAGYVGGKLS